MAIGGYVLFEVSGAVYAVPYDQVKMVEMVGTITQVPRAPEFVEGVASVRGQVIPVVSMRRRFKAEAAPPTPELRRRLLVIRINERSIAMLVDSAREFLRVSEDQVGPVPEGLSGPGLEYLEGVISLPNRVILLVNLPKLFSPEEHSALEHSVQPEQARS